MANNDTIYMAKAAAPLVNPTTATVFTVVPNPLTPTATAQPAICYAQESDNASYSVSNPAIPTTQSPGSTQWQIRVRGHVVPGASGTFGLSLYIGNSATVANNVLLIAPTAQTFATAGSFTYVFTLVYSASANRLDGYYSGAGGSTFVAVTPTVITGQALTLATNQKQPFVLGGIFGTSNAANVAYLDEFSLEQV